MDCPDHDGPCTNRKCQTRREAGTESLGSLGAARTSNPAYRCPRGCQVAERVLQMQTSLLRTSAILLLSFIITQVKNEARAQYSRQTPIVEAVKKTRPSIVAIKAEKKGTTGAAKETVGTGVIVDERGYVVT